PAADLLEAERLAVEIKRGIEVANAQHGVQISHGTPLMCGRIGRSSKALSRAAYMIAPDLKTAHDRLQELIGASHVVLPFTGGGISTGGGIPDCRSRGGMWTKMQPIPFAASAASQEMRDESWRRRFIMEEKFGAAQPGRGHRALASLYRAGKVPAVVTQ